MRTEVLTSRSAPPALADFAYISSALRMATKYGVIQKRDAIILSLPDTLHQLFFKISPAEQPHPAEVIAFLREYDYHCPEDLAMLLYKLSLHLSNHPAPLSDEKMGMLAHADLQRLAVGTGRLHRAHAASVRFLANANRKAQCQSAMLCHPVLQTYWATVADPLLHADESVIDGWVRLRDEVQLHGIAVDGLSRIMICYNCENTLRNHILQITQRMIDQLPSYFLLV